MGTVQMVCCVTRSEREDDDEGAPPLVEQKPLFPRAESFATTVPAASGKCTR
jgi:hypothetical protein